MSWSMWLSYIMYFLDRCMNDFLGLWPLIHNLLYVVIFKEVMCGIQYNTVCLSGRILTA